MTLKEIAEGLRLRSLTPTIAGERSGQITGGYVSDLLSDVLANAPAGGILVTILTHINVLAVSLHAGLAAIVFASGRSPDEAFLQKAAQEQIPLYASEETSFDLAGQLYALGLRGKG